MEQVQKDIADIKEAMKEHNLADDRRFDDIISTNRVQTARLEELIVQMQPMTDWFKEMTLGKRIKWEWITSTSKVGGAILVIIAVVGAIWAGIKLLVVNALK